MKQSEAEEIFLAKPSSDTVGQSFCTYLETSSLQSNENSGDSKNDEAEDELETKQEKEKTEANNSDEETVQMVDPNSNNVEQMNIFEEKQKESVSLTPKLIKSLMHRKVIKISSGGVHNICIVEPYPNHMANDIYKQFMNSKYTDVCFVFKEKNYCFRDNMQEEDKYDESDDESSFGIVPKNKLRKGYFEYKINAHKFLLAARSPAFRAMFKKSSSKSNTLEKKTDMTASSEQSVEVIQIKD
jgi:hypothetical protein